MIAIRNDWPDVIGLVIDRGAKMEAVNKQGLTALMVAAEHEKSRPMGVLIDRGAKLEARDTTG